MNKKTLSSGKKKWKVEVTRTETKTAFVETECYTEEEAQAIAEDMYIPPSEFRLKQATQTVGMAEEVRPEE